MTSHHKTRTDSCSGVLQHADVVALVTYPTVERAGQQGPHRQATAQLSTPVPPLSLILSATIKRHPSTLLRYQIKDTIIKVTNKIKVILEVNSKVWSCSHRRTLMRRNVVEILSTHLLRVPHPEKEAAMESSDNHRRA